VVSQKILRAKDRGKRFCDRSCSAKWRMSRPGYAKSLATPKLRETSRANMKKLLERPDVQAKLAAYLSGPSNPVRDPANRIKAQTVLRERGYSMLNGGNGRGLTAAQSLLQQRLGWAAEFAVPTKQPRGSGYPTAYKLDLADPVLRIGIELDGHSHCSARAKEKDAKKTALLESLGWTVLRFQNSEVIANLDSVVARVVASTT
jgi:hypothetical protein